MTNSIFDQRLLEDFKNYSTSDFVNLKAKRVFYLCMKNKKYRIAEMIDAKYKVSNTNDDYVNAFYFAMMAKKKLT